MRFEMLQWVFLLWTLPILAAFLIWRYFSFQQLSKKLAEAKLLARIAPLHSSLRLVWRSVLATGVLVFCVLALLRPQWGYRWQEVEQKGVDIVVALDLSDSMLAEDVSPNRLERARRKINDLLKILEGDRIGLVAFSGMAIVQSPLTMDYGAIDLFLRNLDTDSLPVKGTSLGAAIDQATKVFEMAESTSRALLLVTDGEELDERAIPAAEDAKKKGIRIYSIGVGSEKGAPIPNRDGGGFRKKPDGEIVFSKLNEGLLAKLASVTGGTFVRSVSDDADLVRIYRDDIRKDIEAKNQKSTRVKRFEERFQWPLGIAIALIFAELMLFTFRGKKTTALLAFFICASFFHTQKAFSVPFTSQRYDGEKKYEAGKYPESAKSFEGASVANPSDADARFNLGSAYYKAGEFSKAEEAWKSLMQGTREMENEVERKRLQQETLYNLGNAAYRQGRLEDAVNSYRAAKEMDSADREAAHNLEIALAEIKRRKEEQQKQQQKPKEQREKEKQQEKSKQQQEQQQEQKQDKKQDEKKQQENQQDGGRDKQPDKQPKQKQNNPHEQQRQLSKDEAERLLDSLNDEKKKSKEDMRKPRSAPENSYDW